MRHLFVPDEYRVNFSGLISQCTLKRLYILATNSISNSTSGFNIANNAKQQLVLFPVKEYSLTPGRLDPEPRYVGIAPDTIKWEDLVCRFGDTDIAAIFRPDPEFRGYQMVGRAVLCSIFTKIENFEWPPRFEVQAEYSHSQDPDVGHPLGTILNRDNIKEIW
jgi:hypothetical protein